MIFFSINGIGNKMPASSAVRNSIKRSQTGTLPVATPNGGHIRACAAMTVTSAHILRQQHQSPVWRA
jgi:hypothetical protein